jgi:hypothetical protein
MLCKDCIHFDVCKDATVPNPEYKGVQPDKSKECRHFKNKADVVEVKHGHWMEEVGKIGTPSGITIKALVGYRCSVCNRAEFRKEPYCNCGAKMDERSNT